MDRNKAEKLWAAILEYGEAVDYFAMTMYSPETTNREILKKASEAFRDAEKELSLIFSDIFGYVPSFYTGENEDD